MSSKTLDLPIWHNRYLMSLWPTNNVRSGNTSQFWKMRFYGLQVFGKNKKYKLFVTLCTFLCFMLTRPIRINGNFALTMLVELKT